MKRSVTLSQREVSEIIAKYVMENYLLRVDSVNVVYEIKRNQLVVTVEEDK